MIKLIHPKTGVVREIEESYQLKLRLLKRAGFILYKNYKPQKKKAVVPDPTVAEIVAKNKEEGIEETDEPTTELAIHVSPAARALIEKHELDPALIKGTGKEGAITKPDVSEYLDALKAQSEAVAAMVPTAEEVLEPAEDIPTHDDPPADIDGELSGEDIQEMQTDDSTDTAGFDGEMEASPTANTEEETE